MQTPSRYQNRSSKTEEFRLEGVLKYTKLCEFFLRGECLRAAKCNFAHSKDQLQAQPDLSKTVLCARFMSGGSCKRASHCKFAHGTQELKVGGFNPTPTPTPKVSRCDQTPTFALCSHSRTDKLAKLDAVLQTIRPFVSEKHSFLHIRVPHFEPRRSWSVPPASIC